MIPIAKPLIEEEEIKAVHEVLQSGNIAQGPKVAELEERFAQYCGTKHALAVNSGTAAIHAALHAVGVREGDEVITVPFSFIATINPIVIIGATPVLVDVSEGDFCMDVTQLEAAITEKTKAIIPVHLYGQAANMDEINEIAKRHGVAVIEDACQAIGATYGEKKAGNLGDVGCFSLYATKNIMCGEGGMVTTNNDEVAAAVRSFRQHGMSAPYVYEELGYNYRLTDLQAAIAVEQVKKVDRFTLVRQNSAQALSEGLSGVDGIVLPSVSDNRSHVYHQYTIRVTEACALGRDEFVDALRTRGVGAGVYYPRALHTYPHIAKLGFRVGDYPVAEKIAAQVISLPIHPAVSREDLKTIIDTVKEVASGK